MPLYNIGNEQPIVGVPRMFASDFKRLQDALTQAEFQGVIDQINELIDAAGAEIATAGWLPGSNWEGTAFQPIYSKAVRKNQALAGKLFGLCVWYTVTQRPGDWSSGRYQKNGRDIGSRTYFRSTH